MAPQKKKAEPAGQTAVAIPSLNVQRLQLRVVGDSPLIVHAWSEKARRLMLAKQTKQPREAKAAKDPWADYLDSLYWLSERPEDATEQDVAQAIFGFPLIGVKGAIVSAGSFAEGVTKVELRGALHLIGEFAPIAGTPQMREDICRVGMGVADLRYRAIFEQWALPFEIRFNAAVLTPEQIVHLLDIAGFAVGIGEWRPQRNGSYGRFHVAREGEA